MYQGEDRSTTVADVLEFRTGEEMKAKTNFWVAIFNGEKTPKCIVELQHRKLFVKVEVSVLWSISYIFYKNILYKNIEDEYFL